MSFASTSSFLSIVAWVHGTPDSVLQQGGRETYLQGPRRACVPKETIGNLWFGPCFCPNHQAYIYFYPEPNRQPAWVILMWGHQLARAKVMTVALRTACRLEEGREKGVYVREGRRKGASFKLALRIKAESDRLLQDRY